MILVPTFRGNIQSAASGLPVTSGLMAQWESDSITGKNDGDTIATWTDSSGNSRDATQSSDTLKPLYKTNIFGTKPSVRFDGSNDLLSFTPTSIPSFTFFIVWRLISFKAFGEPLIWRAVSQAGFNFHDGIGNAGAWTPNFMATNTSNSEIVSKDINSAGLYQSPFPTANKIHCHRWNGTDGYYRLNGGSITGIGSFPAGYTGFPTLAQIGHGYDYCNCDIGAILVYNAALSDADLNSTFTYLNTKYAVY